MLNNSRAVVRIVIPAHDEERRIGPTLVDFCEFFAERATIVVVANACKDATASVVERLQNSYSNLHLINIPSRIGKGGAIRAGLLTGTEPFVGFVDADHCTSAEEYDRLLSLCQEQAVDGIIGSRWKYGAIVEPRQPWKRRIASRVFNWLVRSVMRLPFEDTQCGAKLFRREAVLSAAANLRLSGFAFDIDLLYSVRMNGGKVLEEPSVWSDADGSKVKIFPSSLHMLASLIRLRIERSPFSSMPFLDSLAAESVIPIYRAPNILVLADRFESSHPVAENFAFAIDREIGEAGSIHYAPQPFSPGYGARLLNRLIVLAWYFCGRHRRYDTIVEVESDLPFLVPAISSKPCYLLASPLARSSMAEAWAYGRFYRRVERVNHGGAMDKRFARTMRFAAMRTATFEMRETTWLMHFYNKDHELLTLDLSQ